LGFLGKEIPEVTEESRRSGSFHPTLNATFLALAPKVGCYDSPKGFRAIALCNVIYKIISMIIVNRLKLIPPSLVS